MSRWRTARTTSVAIGLSLLVAACSVAGAPPTSVALPSDGPAPAPASAMAGTTAPQGTNPADATLSRRGFPDDCPELSTSFDLMNAASYQVFAEQVARDEQGQAKLVHAFLGTAWAIDERVLATNAHVAEIFPQSAAQGVQLSRAIAVQSGTGTVIRLVRGFTHPEYDGGVLTSPDVGLFESEQALPAVLPLAPADSILGLGDEIQIVGFPGDVDMILAVVPGQTVPQATSLTGRVTARRSHDESGAVTPETLDVYQHQAPTTPGTSGSSMFHCGLVAGINNAGTNRFVLTPGPAGEGQFTVDRQAAASNNFAVHVRHIHDLFDRYEAGALQGLELPVAAAAAPPGTGGGGGSGQPARVAGRYAGVVVDPAAQHALSFTIGENGVIEGTSAWEETGQFVLAGQANPDGTFQMADNAPERLGFRRGIYQGAVARDGSITGMYFEQTQEQTSWQFVARRSD